MARSSRLAKGEIQVHSQELDAFCKRWQVSELALFGSVLRDDFGPDSDVDVLVRFLPEAQHGLFEMVTMEEELSQLLGRKVDLVSRRAVLESAEVIYAA